MPCPRERLVSSMMALHKAVIRSVTKSGVKAIHQNPSIIPRWAPSVWAGECLQSTFSLEEGFETGKPPAQPSI